MTAITWQRVGSWVLVLLPAAIIGYVGVQRIASTKAQVNAAMQMQLDQTAAAVEQSLNRIISEMPERAAIIARSPTLADAVKNLRTQINAVPMGSEPNERLRTKIENARIALQDEVNTLLDAAPQVESIAILDAAGVVIWSNTDQYAIGERLGPVNQTDDNGTENDEPDEDVAVAAEDEAKPKAPLAAKPDEGGLPYVAVAVAGEPGEAVLLKNNVIHSLATAPLFVKNKLAGVVLVERKIQKLDKTIADGAVVIGQGTLLFGTPPSAMDAAAFKTLPANDFPFLVVLTPPTPRLLSAIRIPIGPFAIESQGAGTFARRVIWPKQPHIWGLVFADNVNGFSEIADNQIDFIFALLIMAFLSVVAIELTRARICIGIERLADLLGRAQQGKAEDKTVDEKRLSPELRRLGLLVKKIATSVMPTVGHVAPTIDDVILAAHNIAPDPSEMEFAGLTDKPSHKTPAAGSKPRVATPIPAKMPPEETPDGYESLASMAESLADLPSEVDKLQQQSLPNVPEAMEALNQLDAPNNSTADSQIGSGLPLEEELFSQEASATSIPTPPPEPESPIRKIYNEFVRARESCGETISELNFEKFSAKIEITRNAVMSKHQCKDVHFEVYVKEGRAALRATPTR